MAGYFDENQYENIKDRIKRFYVRFPEGRITTDILHQEKDEVVTKSYLYKNQEEQIAGTPLATGIAREEKPTGKGFAIDKYYENCETSSAGRALANYDMADHTKGGEASNASLQEMQSAMAMRETREREFEAKGKRGSTPQAPSAPPAGNMTKSAQILDRQIGEAKSVTKMMDKCPIHGCDWFQTSIGYAHPVCANGCNHEPNEKGWTVHDKNNTLKTDDGHVVWCPSPNHPMTQQNFFHAHRNVLGWDAAYVETVLKAPVEQIQSLHDSPEAEYSAVWGTLIRNAKESSDDNIWDQE